MDVADGVGRPVVLHTSWRGRLKAVGAPLLLLIFAALGLALGGVGPVAIGSLVVALLLMVVVAFDYPLHVVFGPDGVERRCPLRREHLPWGGVGAIIRPAYQSQLRRWLGSSTGLVAQLGRRRYLLTDRMESRYEFAAWTGGLHRWDRGVQVRASEPPDDTAPTWLHKKRVGPDETGLVDHL